MLKKVGESRQPPVLPLKQTALMAFVIEILNRVDTVCIDIVQPHSCLKCCVLHPVPWHFEVNEDMIEVLLVLEVPLTKYPEVENLLCIAASWAEACLFLSNDLLSASSFRRFRMMFSMTLLGWLIRLMVR